MLEITDTEHAAIDAATDAVVAVMRNRGHDANDLDDLRQDLFFRCVEKWIPDYPDRPDSKEDMALEQWLTYEGKRRAEAIISVGKRLIKKTDAGFEPTVAFDPNDDDRILKDNTPTVSSEVDYVTLQWEMQEHVTSEEYAVVKYREERYTDVEIQREMGIPRYRLDKLTESIRHKLAYVDPTRREPD